MARGSGGDRQGGGRGRDVRARGPGGRVRRSARPGPRARGRPTQNHPARPARGVAVTTSRSLGASLEKFARGPRTCRRTEVGEAEEPFGTGRRARRRCPTSATPIAASTSPASRGCARQRARRPRERRALARARHLALVGRARDRPRQLPRPRSHARAASPDGDGIVVYPERMRENLEQSRGVVFSGTVLLELARRGVSREQAYSWVQRNAMRSHHEARDFRALLLEDGDMRPGAVARGHRARLQSSRPASKRGPRCSIACFQPEGAAVAG